MILFKKAKELQDYLSVFAGEALAGSPGAPAIGFVPTMGALHPGHISLIDSAKKENRLTVCSVFINPTQFNDRADFEKYPVTLEKDIYALEKAGCDILFLPSVNEIYPGDIPVKDSYDLGYLGNVLEGKYRPGHFQGVCMVMRQLLEIVGPGRLYLGQKDYQQCLVITKLIELIGMKEKINVIISPTLREADGLAMSSRNLRLNVAERIQAPAIYQSLLMIRDGWNREFPDTLQQRAQHFLRERGFKTDYVAIADAKNLQPVTEGSGDKKIVALVASFLNEVRLIDNMLLN